MRYMYSKIFDTSSGKIEYSCERIDNGLDLEAIVHVFKLQQALIHA